MTVTLHLTDEEAASLRLQAEVEQRTVQEVARDAVREYVERHSRRARIDEVLDAELPRYADALERLGQ